MGRKKNQNKFVWNFSMGVKWSLKESLQSMKDMRIFIAEHINVFLKFSALDFKLIQYL